MNESAREACKDLAIASATQAADHAPNKIGLYIHEHGANDIRLPCIFFIERQDEWPKRKKLEAYTVLCLNREICKKEAWTEVEIAERGLALFAHARQIWPRPDSKGAY